MQTKNPRTSTCCSTLVEPFWCFFVGNIHTHFVRQNIKMTFLVQPTHPPQKTLDVTKYFVVVKHPTKVTLKTEKL